MKNRMIIIQTCPMCRESIKISDFKKNERNFKKSKQKNSEQNKKNPVNYE